MEEDRFEAELDADSDVDPDELAALEAFTAGDAAEVLASLARPPGRATPGDRMDISAPQQQQLPGRRVDIHLGPGHAMGAGAGAGGAGAGAGVGASAGVGAGGGRLFVDFDGLGEMPLPNPTAVPMTRSDNVVVSFDMFEVPPDNVEATVARRGLSNRVSASRRRGLCQSLVGVTRTSRFLAGAAFEAIARSQGSVALIPAGYSANGAQGAAGVTNAQLAPPCAHVRRRGRPCNPPVRGRGSGRPRGHCGRGRILIGPGRGQNVPPNVPENAAANVNGPAVAAANVNGPAVAAAANLNAPAVVDETAWPSHLDNIVGLKSSIRMQRLSRRLTSFERSGFAGT
jgi:hypothetical protein